MVLFPCRTFIIKTNLNKDESIKKLSKNYSPINKLGGYNILSSQPFAGEILGNRFKIYEHYPFTYAKSGYLIEGKIEENEINIKISLGPLLKTMFFVIAIVFGLVGVGFLYVMLRDKKIVGFSELFPLAIPILMYITILVNFNFYSARIENLLKSIFIQ